jgi:hypothetical protein
VEEGGVAVGRLVAVDPDPGGGEHGGEGRAVVGAQIVEQRAEPGGVALVVTAGGRFARLREQADADAQRSPPVAW